MRPNGDQPTSIGSPLVGRWRVGPSDSDLASNKGETVRGTYGYRLITRQDTVQMPMRGESIVVGWCRWILGIFPKSSNFTGVVCYHSFFVPRKIRGTGGTSRVCPAEAILSRVCPFHVSAPSPACAPPEKDLSRVCPSRGCPES